MIALLIYPVPRLEPTETGPRLTLWWTVRGWKRHRKGCWLIANVHVSHVRALPSAVHIVRTTRSIHDVATLEEAMRGAPGVRVTRFGAGPGDDWTEEGQR